MPQLLPLLDVDQAKRVVLWFLSDPSSMGSSTGRYTFVSGAAYRILKFKRSTNEERMHPEDNRDLIQARKVF